MDEKKVKWQQRNSKYFQKQKQGRISGATSLSSNVVWSATPEQLSTKSILKNDRYWNQPKTPEFNSRPSGSKATRSPETLSKRSLKRGVSNAQATFMNKTGSKLSKLEKKIPSPIMKAKGLRAKLAMGALSMLNVGVMKAIGKQSVGMFERFMQDGAVGRNMLNAARIGGKAAVGIGLGMGTVGLSNALSANRHGRGS